MKDTEEHVIQVGRGKFFSAKTNALFSDANPAPSAKASGTDANQVEFEETIIVQPNRSPCFIFDGTIIIE